MKIGFDIHGVIDSFDIFPNMISALLATPDAEIYIITGLAESKASEEIGHLLDLSKVKYFSIVDYLIEQGEHVEWVNDLPYCDKAKWDVAKADFCLRENIDVLFDDSPVYSKHFDNIDTVYCQVINKHRRVYKTR